MSFSARYHGVNRNPTGKGWRWWYVTNPYKAPEFPRSKRFGGAAPSEKKARAALYAFLRKRHVERARIELLARVTADKKIGDRSDFEKRWRVVYDRAHRAAIRQSKVLQDLLYRERPWR